MKNAILLHGRPDPGDAEYYNPDLPSASNSHWFPWLQKQLLMHDIAAQTPEIPNSWQPYYPTWQKEFERYDITPETILVGHSCGGGFLVRWLSEHKDVKVGKVVLVAPWIDPGHKETTDFFDFTIDPKLVERAAGITIFNSDNDFNAIQKSVNIIRETVSDINYREFHNYGHFCERDLGTNEFPELIKEVL
jgi:hypothetical protein